MALAAAVKGTAGQAAAGRADPGRKPPGQPAPARHRQALHHAARDWPDANRPPAGDTRAVMHIFRHTADDPGPGPAARGAGLPRGATEVSQPSLADIVSHIHSLPAMPAVALDLLQTLSGSGRTSSLASRIARTRPSPPACCGWPTRPLRPADARRLDPRRHRRARFLAVRSLVLTSGGRHRAGKCAGFAGPFLAPRAGHRRRRPGPGPPPGASRERSVHRRPAPRHRPAGDAVQPDSCPVIQIAEGIATRRWRPRSSAATTPRSAQPSPAAGISRPIPSTPWPPPQPGADRPGSLAAIIHYADGISPNPLDPEGAQTPRWPIAACRHRRPRARLANPHRSVLAETHGRFEAHLPLLG